jgi:hypothetical protein
LAELEPGPQKARAWAEQVSSFKAHREAAHSDRVPGSVPHKKGMRPNLKPHAPTLRSGHSFLFVSVRF